MIHMNERQIHLQAQPADKQEAIRLVGKLLIENDNIGADYVTSMEKREEVVSTYLGNGIAIPHGMNEHRDLIKHTGVAVLQVPAGVTWNDGEIAHLIVGIAAKSDEHAEVLGRLTRILSNEQEIARLISTTDPQDMIEILTGERPAPSTPPLVPDHAEQFFDGVVRNKTGLHARPAAMFVNIAKRFQADIQVQNGKRSGNGKRLLSLLQLGAGYDAHIRVSAQGVDASAALKALREALEQKFNEEDEVSAPVANKSSEPAWIPREVAQTFVGVAAAPGLAIGPIKRFIHKTIKVEDHSSDSVAEGEHLQQALNAAQHDLSTLYEQVSTRSGASQAAIFQAHGEFLNDTALIQQTVTLINQGHSAAWSWQQSIAERVNQLKQLNDPVLAGRSADLNDVGNRVLRHLTGDTNVQEKRASAATPSILIADDLAPSDTATLDPLTVLGFCTAGGGPTSHTAIIARSLGIPAIVGAGKEMLTLQEDTMSILDGSNGKLYLQPGNADIQHARALQQQSRKQQNVAAEQRFEPAMTTDQQRIEVVANIGNVEDARKAAEAGAEGVGLLRTEFLYLARNSAPTEDEQFEVYRAIVQALKHQPVIIRTLDIGGDKEVTYLNLPREDNPFLGIRGVRLCFEHPELFIPQLRAIYRAAAYGPVSMMFPMIATLEDWEKAYAIAEQVRQELDAPKIPIGIMIEVPAAAILAEQFAREAAFFSIGTNDLTQYTLAMDRGHPQLARQADSLHPAVLFLIKRTVEAAHQAGKWVGVCGGLASDPLGARILIGLGVKELSVSIPSIAAIKALIRSSSLTDMQNIAQQALHSRNAAEVHNL